MGHMIEGHRKDKMKHVKLEDVIVENRARKDLGNMDELVESIRQKGIIQPVTVDSFMRLLAGGRRHACAVTLGLPTIPVIIRDFVDDTDSLEIELIENIHRKDFGWAEQAALVARIDKLYKDKYGADWSGRKTAILLDKGRSNVARNIELARAIEVIPELGEYKTADEAMKILKKMENTAIIEELRTRQRIRVDAAEDPVHSGNHLERGLKDALRLADKSYQILDVFEGLSKLRDTGHINIIECDPPYGIDLNGQKASKGSVTSTVTSYEEVPREEYASFLDKLTSELYRVAGKDCWLVFWFGPTWHQTVLDSLRRAGWQVDEIPAIWTKTQGQTLQPELYLARGYEPFFMCRKGKPVMAERGRLNVFNYPGVAGKQKYHPTQRPLELINAILTTLGAGQQQVLVPFLGSGATLLSCFNIGFHGFGFDLNGEYKNQFMLEVEKETRKLFAVEISDKET